MKNKQQSLPITVSSLTVTAIEFNQKDEVGFVGTYQGRETVFIARWNEMETIFRQNYDKIGRELFWRIEQMFAAPHAAKAEINLVETFGMPQVFEGIKVTADAAYYLDTDGQLKPHEDGKVFFIEEVKAL